MQQKGNLGVPLAILLILLSVQLILFCNFLHSQNLAGVGKRQIAGLVERVTECNIERAVKWFPPGNWFSPRNTSCRFPSLAARENSIQDDPFLSKPPQMIYHNLSTPDFWECLETKKKARKEIKENLKCRTSQNTIYFLALNSAQPARGEF